jgi:uncharacterized protein (DUF2252 family)
MSTARARRRPAKAERREAPLPTLDTRLEAGKALRAKVSRASHAGWEPPRRRRDPIDILIESSRGRLEDLIPVRYGRMLQSPFTFFRGAAAVMASDLAHTPATGLHVQACGDSHLLNFGGFATPERRMIFDINDFDETLPAPWEWDLKRLAASFVIAGRSRKFAARECRAAATAAVASYREHMSEFAALRTLEVWYASVEGITEGLHDPAMRRFYKRRMRKEARRDVASEFANVGHHRRAVPRIKDDPPLVYHIAQERDPRFWITVKNTLERYRESLPDDRRVLYDRFRLCDIAMKVVGVGSVGTLCGVALFLACEGDSLFLQIKEARSSVLEPFTRKSVYDNEGQRVVVGQRLMQAASDIFLGWTEGDRGRNFYIRQLRDMKIKPVIEVMEPVNLVNYGTRCGWALARAHARSGDAAALAGYMGKSTAFDKAITAFAVAYADQNERDHKALLAAVRAGRLEARTE